MGEAPTSSGTAERHRAAPLGSPRRRRLIPRLRGPTVRGTAKAPRSATFRPDVEGLRALAIALVILAHAGVPFAAGGYVGVDVFFVISGFLITRLLIGEFDRRGTVSLTRFYARRIKRLLPQAAMAVMAVVVASWLLLSPVRARIVGHDVVAAGAYVINWHFAAQSVDYFATGSADRPLDHFWSLAVEEQYYLVWPLLLLLITRPWRRRPVASHRALAVALASITIVSLVYAVHLVAVDPAPAYFSTPARAWELGLGGLLALAPIGRIPTRVAASTAWCGFAAIVVATVAFGPNTAFPGLAALLPTLGAAALVAAGASTTSAMPTRLLSLGPAQALGRMSYAWYVWHWPVLVFAAAEIGPLSTPQALLVSAASLVPTAITHRLVEEPIRRSDLHRRRPRLTLAAAPIAASLMVVLGIGLVEMPPSVRQATAREAVGASELRTRHSTQTTVQALRPTPEQADADRSRAYYDGCLLRTHETRSPACVYGDPESSTTVILFGDSHAMQYFPAIESVARRRHWRMVELTKGGCPAADVAVSSSSTLGRAYPECTSWRRSALRRIARERPAMVIVSGSAHSYRVLAGGAPLSRSDSNAALVAGYRRTFQRLSAGGAVVAVVHDTPRPPFDVPSCVADALHHLRRCAFSRRDARAFLDPVSAGAQGGARVRVLDPITEFCPARSCPAVIGNVLVYRQTGHITATYVATMAPWFERRLPTLRQR